MQVELQTSEELLRIDEFGGKAGPLLYIADQLSHIPQPKQIVASRREDNDRFARRMLDAGILGDVLLRSSRTSELFGDEGKFPTIPINLLGQAYGFPLSLLHNNQSYSGQEALTQLATLVDQVRGDGGIIAARHSPSQYHCVLVGHPGNPGQIVATVTELSDNLRTTYICDTRNTTSDIQTFAKNPEPVRRFKTNSSIYGEEGLAEVLHWYDAITQLSAFDPNMTYQLEIGLKPAFLYQIRQFRTKDNQTFTLPTRHNGPNYLVFGTTPPEGIECCSAIFDLKCRNRLIVDELRNIEFTDTDGASLVLNVADGMLMHGDTRAMRQAPLAILFAEQQDLDCMKDSHSVLIRSDGEQVEINGCLI